MADANPDFMKELIRNAVDAGWCEPLIFLTGAKDRATHRITQHIRDGRSQKDSSILVGYYGILFDNWNKTKKLARELYPEEHTTINDPVLPTPQLNEPVPVEDNTGPPEEIREAAKAFLQQLLTIPVSKEDNGYTYVFKYRLKKSGMVSYRCSGRSVGKQCSALLYVDENGIISREGEENLKHTCKKRTKEEVEWTSENQAVYAEIINKAINENKRVNYKDLKERCPPLAGININTLRPMVHRAKETKKSDPSKPVPKPTFSKHSGPSGKMTKVAKEEPKKRRNNKK